MAFQDEFARVVGVEGNYSNHPKDRGGPTKFGITEQVARAHGYKDDMAAMPLSVAEVIYRRQYWDLLKLDAVEPLAAPIAGELFDMGVNCGVAIAGAFLQRTLNVLNRQGRDYPDLAVDGVIGQVTVHHLGEFLKKRGRDGAVVIVRALRCLRGARYIEISEKRPDNEEFTYGWLLNRVGG